MKNLKIFKTALAYATASFIGISIASLIDVAESNIKPVVESNNEDNDIKASQLPYLKYESNDLVLEKTNSSDDSKSEREVPEVTVTPTSTPNPTATPIVIEKYPKNSYGYIVRESNLRKGPKKTKKKISKLNAFQTVKLIEKEEDYVLVKYEGKKGYIYKKNIEELKEEFVDIDISKQQLKLYNEEGKKKIETSIVSGTETNPKRRSTRGAFEVFYKGTDRYLEGPGYKSYVNYFAAYNGGEGMHDASWRSNFGGNIYKYSGSHGCINLAPSVAPKVFKKVKIGTKVIVHD